jgi:hypothetical protein
VRDASRSRGVVGGMVVRVELVHCFRSISATFSFTSVVSLGNKALIESRQRSIKTLRQYITVGIVNKVKIYLPSRREPVNSCVNNFFVENTSRLLGDSLTEVTVGLDLRSVSSVPRNSHRLTRNRGLKNRDN